MKKERERKVNKREKERLQCWSPYFFSIAKWVSFLLFREEKKENFS